MGIQPTYLLITCATYRCRWAVRKSSLTSGSYVSPHSKRESNLRLVSMIWIIWSRWFLPVQGVIISKFRLNPESKSVWNPIWLPQSLRTWCSNLPDAPRALSFPLYSVLSSLPAWILVGLYCLFRVEWPARGPWLLSLDPWWAATTTWTWSSLTWRVLYQLDRGNDLFQVFTLAWSTSVRSRQWLDLGFPLASAWSASARSTQ